MEWNEIASTVFTVFVIPILSVLSVYIVKFIRTKTEELKTNIGNQDMEKYIQLAEDAVCKAVIAVNQTYVESLKKQGRFDLEAQREAFDRARDIALSIMDDAAKKALNAFTADFDVWVSAAIENAVNANKVVV